MKKVYISWHYTTHGIAYLKHILSAFYSKEAIISEDFINRQGLEQSQMNEVFDEKIKEGLIFDKVYYLSVHEDVIHKLTDRRNKYRLHMYQRDDLVINSGIGHVWKDVIDKKMPTIQDELEYVKRAYNNQVLDLFISQIWRDMQHYTVTEQLWWWENMSNARKIYDKSKFEFVLFDKINSLRNERDIARAVQKWIKSIVRKHSIDTEYIINVSLGSNETQVAWFVLAETDSLPPKTRFIKTYDDKSDKSNIRFKKFGITEVRKSILSDIKKSLSVYQNAHSASRKLANLKMQTYINQGFAILILGERGTGKSRLVSELKTYHNINDVFEVNCASFDNDSIAESELFGYTPGAFTGGNIKGRNGIFFEANNGILFFDEVHHLSKNVQGRLMKALQTDSNNFYKYRKVGGSQEYKTKFTAIFASNLPLNDLKKKLLPDFYDRIAQLIIELPPLRETPEDREQDWESIWKQLNFDKLGHDVPNSKEIITWLKEQDLYGNYRDLQKIAIYYKSFLELPLEAQILENCTTPFAFTKKQFLKYYNTQDSFYKNNILLEYLFDNKVIQGNNSNEVPHKVLTTRFKNALIQFISKQYPNKNLHKILGINSKKTYYNWINELDKDLPDFH